ncbi:MAG TPA: hypothetical protein VM598_05860 [Bdellovibrionota bacterium]|nr:hypothetical protein [Bdellovibrionota bacterium]
MLLKGTFVLVLGLLTSSLAMAEETRATYPQAFYAEMGGRSLGYGFGFDRVLDADLAAGVGVGWTPTQDSNDNDAGKTAMMIPAYVNYYLSEESGTIFLTAGMTLVTGDVEGLHAKYSGLEFPSRSVLPTIGWGYESRGDSGFLFRLSAYGVWGQKILPWVGFTFGWAF